MVGQSVGFGQRIIAHRGASGDAPENTLLAFRLAWEQGADGIEGDFRLTNDHQPVCIHDADTSRITGGKTKLEVAKATFAQLRELDVGRWKDERFAGERIATLAEVLSVLRPGGKFFLEIKGGPELVHPIAEVLRQAKADLSQIVIISFDHRTVAEVRRTLPEVTAYWLVSYEKDKETGRWKPSVDEILETLRAANAHGLGTQGNPEVVTEQFVRQIRQGGFELNVWTINDEGLARYFQQLGVDSITTDYPLRIRRALGR
ncbi:MAG: glycerophosphodiester phosphodiesterase [Thermoguttaceae bacterium]|nr:glycerophosphodiester phosphodiesterase [Thermoguttaceae bacterium]MDW8079889.1 glycerophosphodiester phosphodiesterase [Thermoguttaceae bacterium]